MDSVTRVDKLTPEQEAQFASYRDKWIEIGLRTGDTDWDTFDEYMPICYEKAGIKYPINIVRVSSPLIGGLAAAVAEGIWRKRRGAVGEAVDGAVRVAVDEAVGGAVRGAVGVAVGGAVGVAVGGAVDEAVGGAVRGAVGVAVRVAVGGAVDGAVDGAVGEAVDGAVRGAVDGAVATAISIAQKAGVSISYHYWLGGQFWVGGWYWGVAFVNFFFDVCKLKLAKDIMERAEAYRKVCESVNYIWPNTDFIMICARPKAIHRNVRGQLHNPRGKSIEYPDGWGLYHLNGVGFPEDLFKKVTSGTMPFKDILAIVDTDQRTQAMRFGDVAEFVKHEKGELLDETTKNRLDGTVITYSLYKFPKGKVFTEDAYYMVYDDLVPGSTKQYMSGVMKSSTVADAMAWKFSSDDYTLTASQWLNLTPGLNMN
jgi:hypothetical protein